MQKSKISKGKKYSRMFIFVQNDSKLTIVSTPVKGNARATSVFCGGRASSLAKAFASNAIHAVTFPKSYFFNREHLN